MISEIEFLDGAIKDLENHLEVLKKRLKKLVDIKTISPKAIQ